MKKAFINFHELSFAKNCARPEIAPLTVLAIKRGLLCNFTKTLEGCHFKGHSATGLTFSITFWKSSKIYLYSLLKNIFKIPISGLNKKVFLKFCLIFKGPPF